MARFGAVDDLGRVLEASVPWAALLGERSGMRYFSAIGGASTSCVSTSGLGRMGFIVSGLGNGSFDSRSSFEALEGNTTLMGLTGDGGEVGE